MMTESEFVEQQRALGRRLHEHTGVWWDTTYPFYSRPAYEFRAFNPGSAKPKWTKSFLGYSHQVMDPALGNRSIDFMVIEATQLRAFGMEHLDSKKRNQVRKGLRCCRVELIADLGEYLEDIRQANISQAERQMGRESFDRPARYYSEHANEWRKDMLGRFGLRGWNWWGAFGADRLVAYMVTCEVEGILFIRAMKTHAEGLPLCATDATYYTVLEHSRDEEDLTMVVNGGPFRPSLDRYKEQFLFHRKRVSYYSHPNWLFPLGARLLRLKETVRRRVELVRRGRRSTH